MSTLVFFLDNAGDGRPAVHARISRALEHVKHASHTLRVITTEYVVLEAWKYLRASLMLLVQEMRNKSRFAITQSECSVVSARHSIGDCAVFNLKMMICVGFYVTANLGASSKVE